MDRDLPLSLLPETFSVCRLAPNEPVPAWTAAEGFYSVTRTAEELSVVCRREAVRGEVRCEGG